MSDNTESIPSYAYVQNETKKMIPKTENIRWCINCMIDQKQSSQTATNASKELDILYAQWFQCFGELNSLRHQLAAAEEALQMFSHLFGKMTKSEIMTKQDDYD